MIAKDLEEAVARECLRIGVPVEVAVGVVEVLSGGGWGEPVLRLDYRSVVDPNSGYAWRTLTPEQYTTDEPPEDWDGSVDIMNSPEEEWLGQKTAWGPMGVYGAEARRLGFTGRFERLSGPDGVRFGVARLKSLHKGDWRGTLEDYADGAYQFAEAVLEAAARYLKGNEE